MPSIERYLCHEFLAAASTFDHYVSAHVYTFSTLLHCRVALLALEWLAHGMPWLGIAIVGLFLSSRFNVIDDDNANSSKSLSESQYKWSVLFVGLLVDLVAVGLVKIIVRRQRPYYNRNDQVYEAPVTDKYSFPSGHSSRAAMLALLMIRLLPNARVEIAFAFPIVLSLSRVMLGRHYASDVLFGLILGVFEGLIVEPLTPPLIRLLKRLYIALNGF